MQGIREQHPATIRAMEAMPYARIARHGRSGREAMSLPTSRERNGARYLAMGDQDIPDTVARAGPVRTVPRLALTRK
jgi:hypothetical protein